MLKMGGWLACDQDLDQYDFGFATGAPDKQIVELARLAFVQRARTWCSSARPEWARLTS